MMRHGRTADSTLRPAVGVMGTHVAGKAKMSRSSQGTGASSWS